MYSLFPITEEERISKLILVEEDEGVVVYIRTKNQNNMKKLLALASCPGSA